MKTKANNENKNTMIRLAIFGLVLAVIIAGFYFPLRNTEAAPNTNSLPDMYQRSAPDFDYNLSRNLQNLRQATSEQISALDQLRSATNANNLQMRWNDFGGSPDVIYDFASQSFSGSPEEAGRAFINQNAALFGVSDLNDLRVFSNREALGGNLIRFQQTFNGVPVKTAESES